MKNVSLALIMLLCCAFFILSCKKSSDEPQPSNQQPATPSSPNPTDAATYVSVTPVLSWTCSDPDTGDSLKFDIYFDSTNPPNTLLVSNWKQPNYALGTLDFNKTYYWRVTAHDLKSASAIGPIWRFTTLSELPTQGLVAYYPFNGNANDESGNGYNGTVHGASLTADRFGKVNNGYNFTNNINYIQVNNFPILNSVFTYCVWVKPSPANSNGQNFGCYGTIDGGVSSWDVGYYIKNQLSVFDRYNLVFIDIVELADSWHFIVVVYNGNIRSIYVDGQFKKSQNITTPIPTNYTDVFRIGMHTDGDGNQQFIGNIDDVRTYNRAISETEILQLYHEGGWTK